MALEVAGVDMLETRGGPKILEINSSPGLEGIERATGQNVAGAIIRHAERYVKRRLEKGPDTGIENERTRRRRHKIT